MVSTIYTAKRLIIPQQIPEDRSEIYSIVDLTSNSVTEIIIDTRSLQNEIVALLKANISERDLPYGYKKYDEMVSYLIQSHSAIADDDDNIYVFYNQIPYFRRINLRTKTSELLPAGTDFNPDVMYSSTSRMDEKGNFFVSINSFSKRIKEFVLPKKQLDFVLSYFDTRTNRLSSVSTPSVGLIDRFHQTACSWKGFVVLLDMNLRVDYPISPDEDYMAADFGKGYLKHDFVIGKIFIYDLKTGALSSTVPPLPTVAHLEFDLEDESIFYASCHNMSKIKSSMVLHGPGAIVKYQYKDGEISNLGSFSQNDFYRITTHKPFRRMGKYYLAVNGYPNYLFIIDAVNMRLVNKIKLFDYSEEVHFTNDVYVCEDNNIIPLYLAVSESGQFVFMVSSNFVYVVDLELQSVVQVIQFTTKNNIPSSHILLA